MEASTPSVSEQPPPGPAAESTLNCTVIWTALLASLGGFLFGFDIGYIGPITSFPGFLDALNAGRPLEPDVTGNIVGLFSIGAVVSSFPTISATFNDSLGRKMSIMVGTVAFSLGAAIQASAHEVHQMMIGRFISGLSIGLFSSTVPMYQSEVAPKEWRGILGSTYQWAITWGILVAFILDEVVNEKDNWGWRFVIWIQILPALMLLLGMSWAPQSPRWLMLKGRGEEALEMLKQLRPTEAMAEAEFREIEESLRGASETQASVADILKFGYSRKLTGLGMTIQMLQQLCGMNAFMYYGVVIFAAMGMPAGTFNCGIGLVNVVATLPGMYAVDRVGRTTLLLWSGICMMLACITCGLLGSPELAAGSETTNDFRTNGVLAACVFFVFSFAYGWGPVAWVYTTEIYPTEYRSTAVALVTCTNWIGNYIIAFITPVLLDSIHFNTFFVFAFFCGIGSALALWLPETKGVRMEDMPKIFEPKLGERLEVSRGLLDRRSIEDRHVSDYSAVGQRNA